MASQEEQIAAAEKALAEFIDSQPPERQAFARKLTQEIKDKAPHHPGGALGVIMDGLQELRGQMIAAVNALAVERKVMNEETSKAYTQILMDDLRAKK